jgi:SAM-dependent methyltransferase
LTTTYDTVAYPAGLFRKTLPQRLSVMAALHGLTPAPVPTARVLEIGCGDGLNIIAMAAAYPNAQFTGFDLSAQAIGRGQALVEKAGMTNVTLEVVNVLDAVQHYGSGSFDYIIAHGVYAWVPQPVQRAIMALFAHALSAQGVAYVSYNAMPVGHFRTVMRAMLLHEVSEIEEPEKKIEAARALLQSLVDNDPGNFVVGIHMRMMAEEMLQRNVSVLFHDELGEVFDPQTLMQVVTAGQEAGLRYLTDAEHVRLFEGFLEEGEDIPDDPDGLVLHRAQALDYREGIGFRISLFVQGAAKPSRIVDPSLIDQFWISTVLAWDEENQRFQFGDNKFLEAEDAEMTAIFHKIVDARPGWLPVAGLIKDEARRRMFLRLFSAGHVDLHTTPAPFVVEIGEKPHCSPLVRAEIALELPRLSRLDHQKLTIDQPHVRALLAAANGQRTVAEMAAMLDGVFPADEIVPALTAVAKKAIMLG